MRRHAGCNASLALLMVSRHPGMPAAAPAAARAEEDPRKAAATPVGLVDPHPAFRAGLAHALEEGEGFRVLAEGADLQRVARSLADEPAWLLVVDGAESGASERAIAAIRRCTPGARILLTFASERQLGGRVAAGADGFILKTSSLADFVAAARTVASGRRFLLPELGRAVSSAVSRRALADPTRLTDRESEVLGLVVQGLSSREIGRELCISPRTVDVHRARLMQKMGARTRWELLALAIRQDPEP